MNVFVVSSWLQHRVLTPNKHRVHIPVLERKLKTLLFGETLLFSIRVPPTISFRFLFLLNTVNGCSGNNSRRLLLVWWMFQFLQATAVRFGRKCYMLILMECVLNLAVLDLFLFLTCPNCSSTSF